LNRTPQISTRLSSDASNLTQIIGLIFENETKRTDFIEWLRILIPESTSISLHRRTRKRSSPQAIELLVDFFREKCETEGHYIWLNTHSQTLVRCLEIDEIILVNKVDGATRAKQLKKEDEINIKTDEGWLSNALGGGVLWSK
jgi:hypothetical protein